MDKRYSIFATILVLKPSGMNLGKKLESPSARGRSVLIQYLFSTYSLPLVIDLPLALPGRHKLENLTYKKCENFFGQDEKHCSMPEKKYH